MKSVYAIAVLPFVFWTLFISPADEASTRLLKGLKTWTDENPQEKVFVQTDRDRFVAGETVWMKAWATLNQKPTFLSRIMYMELTDAAGKVVEKKMYQLDRQGAAHGAIDLSRDLPTGSYALNAYTAWMLNYPQFVFRKTIHIYNEDYSSKSVATGTPTYDVQFFPEGGDLVDGVKSRVAFKATDRFGMPVELTGSVKTVTGETVATIQSEHDGMGSFELQPSAGATYTAQVVIGGKAFTYKLPTAKPEGAVLMVTNTSASRIFVQVQVGEKAKEKYSRLFAIAHMSGLPLFKGDFNFNEGVNAAAFTKKGLPPGIVHITLFDTSGRPLAERLAYVSNYSVQSPELTMQTKSLARRGLNTIRFRLDSVQNPNISFAAVDATHAIAGEGGDGLVSSLLLTSDIKGYVHNPGYYFSGKTDAVQRHLDLLMLTQGWRRFTWKQIVGEEKLALKYPVETHLRLVGKVTKSDRKDLVTSGTVSFVIKGEDSSSMLSTATLTDKGEFIVDSLKFRKGAVISYQGNNAKSSLPVDVHFYPAYIDSLKMSSFSPLVGFDPGAVLDSAVAGKLAELIPSGKNVLQGVTVRSKKRSKADSLQAEYVSAMFEISDQTLVPDRTTYANIWQYLNASIPGFNVNPFQPGGVTSAMFNRNVGINGLSEDANSERNILFVLNEIPVTADVIDALIPSDVALVKVYKGALAFPFGSDGGAISVYTKKGANLSRPGEKNFQSFRKLGFEIQREFYAPDYAAYKDAGTVADNRSTLLWKPLLKPGADGSYTVSFYNNDAARKIKLIVQGIDDNGELIYKEQILQ